jgi:hypothetical protein
LGAGASYGLLFTARQLVWLALTTIGSGMILLVPVFISGEIAASWLAGFLRSLHSASSLLLVLGSLAHAAARTSGRTLPTRKGIATGILASTTLALAALSGGILVTTGWSARALGADPQDLRHAASVFHYGYSAALFGAVTIWHLRPAGSRMLPAWDRGAWIDAVIVPMAAALIGASSGTPSPYTWILMPPTLLAVWSLLVPQIFWTGLLRTRPSARNP